MRTGRGGNSAPSTKTRQRKLAWETKFEGARYARDSTYTYMCTHVNCLNFYSQILKYNFFSELQRPPTASYKSAMK